MLNRNDATTEYRLRRGVSSPQIFNQPTDRRPPPTSTDLHPLLPSVSSLTEAWKQRGSAEDQRGDLWENHSETLRLLFLCRLMTLDFSPSFNLWRAASRGRGCGQVVPAGRVTCAPCSRPAALPTLPLGSSRPCWRASPPPTSSSHGRRRGHAQRAVGHAAARRPAGRRGEFHQELGFREFQRTQP